MPGQGRRHRSAGGVRRAASSRSRRAGRRRRHRPAPLHAMVEAFTGAGFRITVISEPEPDPAAREMFPEAIAAEPRFLCFLFFVLQAD